MKFSDETRTRLLVAVTLDFDPTNATLEVKVDGTWHPAVWIDNPPASSGNKWIRRARTTGYFAGPNVPANGATVLTTGKHLTETRVTNGGDIITQPSTPIEVE